MNPPHSNNYYLAGMGIVSDFALPWLTACEPLAERKHKVEIRRSRLPEKLSCITSVFPDGHCNQDELLFNVPDAARYLVRSGAEILVDPAPGSDQGDVLAYLLGTAFGVLCHQRGMPPLHASAIDVVDGCVAFVGGSGAGKSTIVAALAARGHQVVSDDLCVLERAEKGIDVWPSLHRLRLWEDALLALGCDQPGIEREFRGYNKFLVPLEAGQGSHNSRRLRRVYQLVTAAQGDRATITRLHGADVVEVLMQNIYRAPLAEHMGHKATLFVMCAAVAREVPVYRLSRPLNFLYLREVMEVLESHLHEVVEM
jgi:hypothetical protein